VYLPYSFHQGSVQFGWTVTANCIINGRRAGSMGASMDSDFVRVGTNYKDESLLYRRDDGLDIDTSAMAALDHLDSAIGEVLVSLRGRLLDIEYGEYIDLSPKEERLLSCLLHPWGIGGELLSDARIDGWKAQAMLSVRNEPYPMKPIDRRLARTSSQPPSSGDLITLAEWYGPLQCEVLARSSLGTGSAGSGVLVSGDGLVLTCAHVLTAPRISVQFHEGPWAAEYPAEVVFVNEVNDVALIKARGLKAARWAPIRLSAPTLRGEPIVAMGSPAIRGGGTSLGTLTSGIVANPGADRFGSPQLVADITISSGSSGGPLISVDDGQVVGVVLAVLKAGLSQETDDPIASSGYSCLAAPAHMLGDWLGLKE